MELMHNRITCMIGAYNEAGRIRLALEGLAQWADEIIVYDKGSTDGTPDIAKSVSSKVRILPVPHTERGCEDFAMLLPQARNEWVYWATCSEVPTRRLVEEMDKLITAQGDSLDVVGIPRRMYSMGLHSPHSPWSISHYPFCFHRQRVILPGLLHDHFRARSRERHINIAYAPDTCVHHFTHASFADFMDVHVRYAAREAATARAGEQPHRLKQALRTLLGSLYHERGVQVHGMAYAVYSLLVCLKLYEIQAGGPWQRTYAGLASRLIADEWGAGGRGTRLLSTTPSGRTRLTVVGRVYRVLVRGLVHLLIGLTSRRNREHD